MATPMDSIGTGTCSSDLSGALQLPPPPLALCHGKVPPFCNFALGVCLPEVPLPQLRSRGHVFAKFFFCNPPFGIMSCEVPLPQLRSEGNVMVKFHNSPMGLCLRVFLCEVQQFCSGVCFRKVQQFHNSALGVMSLRSSASAFWP